MPVIVCLPILSSISCFFVQVFFFKAWYKGGDVAVNKEDATDYMWVTKDELPNFCSRAYLKSVKDFIVDL